MSSFTNSSFSKFLLSTCAFINLSGFVYVWSISFSLISSWTFYYFYDVSGYLVLRTSFELLPLILSKKSWLLELTFRSASTTLSFKRANYVS